MFRISWVIIIWYIFLPGGLSAQPIVRFVKKDSKIKVMADDRLLATYWFDSILSKPIIYPLYSPSGVMLTRSFPFDTLEGESHDHPHHTGISFTYGSNNEVNGNSFWANPHDQLPLAEGPRLPQIRQVKINGIEARPGHASLSTLNHWLGKNGKPILVEERQMDFQAGDDRYVIDMTISLSPFDSVVSFADTKEGMLAIRVADWLAEDANGTLFESSGTYTNAEGEKNEKNIWGKRSAWVNLEGANDKKEIGITIMHHPSSLNFPTYWHARGYGCFAANPIGQYDYQKGRKLANPEYRTLTLQPGDKALFKFRMLIYEGNRSKPELDADFKTYREIK